MTGSFIVEILKVFNEPGNVGTTCQVVLSGNKSSVIDCFLYMYEGNMNIDFDITKIGEGRSWNKTRMVDQT